MMIGELDAARLDSFLGPHYDASSHQSTCEAVAAAVKQHGVLVLTCGAGGRDVDGCVSGCKAFFSLPFRDKRAFACEPGSDVGYSLTHGKELWTYRGAWDCGGRAQLHGREAALKVGALPQCW